MRKGQFIHSLLTSLLFAFIMNTITACSPKVLSGKTDIVQTDSIPSIRQYPEKAKFFTTDKLRQVYLVTTTNEVIKYTSSGKESFRFNTNLYGDLAYVDATNPFNLLLYYPEYLTIITLDRTLSVTGTIRLSELDLLEVKAVGLSNDNNVWVYDEQGRELRKLDQNGRVLFETADLNLLLGTAITPIQLLERDNRVFLNDPEIGIFIFDNFGQYLNKLEIKDAANLQFRSGFLFFEKDEKAMAYELRTLEFNVLPLPASADQWRIEGEQLFIRQGNQVVLYPNNN